MRLIVLKYISLMLLLSACPSWAQQQIDVPSPETIWTSEPNDADLTAKLSAAPPAEITKAIAMWQGNSPPIFAYRRQCFEAMAEGHKSGSIAGVLSACVLAAKASKTSPRRFVASILDAMEK